MNKNRIVIGNIRFCTIGRTINRKINGRFRLVDFNIPFESIEEGESTLPMMGKITKQRGSAGLKNAKVTAYKDNIVYDFIYTNSEGDYYLCLEDGTYDIRIESETYNRVIKNFVVNDGIKLYTHSYLTGQIKQKHPIIEEFKNVIEFEDSNFLTIGTMLDQHGVATKDGELIIVDSETKEIKTFIKTKEDGKYSFLLNRGIYDIIVRSPKHSAKIIRNYNYIPENGFLFDVTDNTNSNYDVTFNNGGEWIWISK